MSLTFFRIDPSVAQSTINLSLANHAVGDTIRVIPTGSFSYLPGGDEISKTTRYVYDGTVYSRDNAITLTLSGGTNLQILTDDSSNEDNVDADGNYGVFVGLPDVNDAPSASGTVTFPTDGLVHLVSSSAVTRLDASQAVANLSIDATGGGISLTASGSSMLIVDAIPLEVLSGQGNDSIFASLGSRVVDAGAGDDTIFIQNRFSDFTLLEASATYARLGTVLGEIEFRNAEHLAFLDGVIHIGGTGFDFARYDQAAAGVIARLDLAGANAGKAAGDVYVSIEGLVGSQYGDVLIGSVEANTLLGQGGDDLIYGLGGHDTIYGGLGNDVLVGGLGDDSFVVDNANDRVTELAGAGEGSDTVYADNVDWSIEAFSPNVETLVVLSSDRIGAGSAGDDRITAYGANNLLIGGGGNDTLAVFGSGGSMYGGTDNDIYVVTSAATNVRESAGEGYDVIYADNLDFSLQASGLNVEALVMRGNGKIGEGTVGNDLLITGGNSNYLFGGAGADVFGLNSGHGVSNVLDFVIGEDKVGLAAATFANFGDVQAHAAQVGANTVITGTGGDAFILTNTQVESLSASDFMFF